eukprot:jgi/Chlat1/319/Chrsp1S03073
MSRREKFKPMALAVPDQPKPAFNLTNSGTFSEGDLVINKTGLRIDGSDVSGSPAARSRPVSRAGSHKDPLRQSTATSRVSPMPMDAEDSLIVESAPMQEGQFDVRLEDLRPICVLGSGSSGTVQKVQHKTTGTILALKVIQLETQEQVRKQIVQELKILHQSYCPYIVACYGAFYSEGAISIVLEFMDAGSLSDIVKAHAGIPERFLAKIAQQVLYGLIYLHKELHIIHRDIKPANLLINHRGEVKISDFGVSGQMANSMAACASWVGTVTYMSPERISGKPYSYDSDLWSLGLTLVECAMGRFPYPPAGAKTAQPAMGFWDLLDYIVEKPPPVLPADKFSPEMCSFVAMCLQKEPQHRPTATDLLEHPFLKIHNVDDVDLSVLCRPAPAVRR